MATTGTESSTSSISGSTTGSNSSSDTDRDFDPSAEMMIHDYDDERTLEEEENQSGGSCSGELDDLEKEGDMPIEDLLAMYGYNNGEPPSVTTSQTSDSRSSSEEEILSNQDLTLDKEEIARDLLSNSEDTDDKETDVHDLLESVESSQTARLLRSKSQADSDESDSEEDIDYKPDEGGDWKKTIQVGSSFQAVVPEGLSLYGDAPAYENEDRLLWDPSKIDDAKVESYLQDIHVQSLNNSVGVNAIPTGAHIRDDEQSLYLLLQCGHNVEEALRRRKMQAIPITDPMSLWSEEECSNFETGLKFYGKDFFHIHQNKVKTRSIGELVQFYYLWKKTERHDIFANKTRLEKRRYTLHPGVTDYMERFLDDQENPPPPPPRDRSASPIHSLLFGDPKRSHLKPHTDPATGPPRIPKARHYRRPNIATGTLSPPFPGFNSPGFHRSTVPIKKSSSNKPSSNKPSSNKPLSSLTSSPTSVLTTIISTSRATTLKLTKLPNRTTFTTSAKSTSTAISIFPTYLGTGTTQYSLNISSSSTVALYQSKSMYHTEKSTQISSISSILNTGIGTTNLATIFHAPQTAHDQSTKPMVLIPVTLSFTLVSTIIFLTGVYILRTRCHRWRKQKVVPQTDI